MIGLPGPSLTLENGPIRSQIRKEHENWLVTMQCNTVNLLVLVHTLDTLISAVLDSTQILKKRATCAILGS